MNTYLVPTILYVVAIVFGVVWVWLCGGVDRYEVIRRCSCTIDIEAEERAFAKYILLDLAEYDKQHRKGN